MTTWAQTNPTSATWSAASSVLYLLQETGDNLQDQTGELILLDRPNWPTWSEKEPTSASWTKRVPN